MALDNLIKDFPAQFQGNRKIEALCSAFDRQIAELFNVFSEIRNDTSIDTAVGKQLDLIGDIVGLTRADASLLGGGGVFIDMLDDERYRQYLKYKAYKNANGCTYSDVLKELKIVSGYDNIKYEENEKYPATIVISLPLSDNGITHTIGGIPTIAPAGVSVLYKYTLGSTINVKMLPEIYAQDIAYAGTFNSGTFPKKV